MGSAIFTCMTQVSHVQEDCQPSSDAAREERCWTARQILTSLDYSMSGGNKLEVQTVTAIAAGLNAQSLHHDVPIRHSDNAATAVSEMFQYMFENNDPARWR